MPWIGCPDDYCGATACHIFYYNLLATADGTFDVTLANAIPGAGKGVIDAHQWNVKTRKWADVANINYYGK
jgi:hypothetical protein